MEVQTEEKNVTCTLCLISCGESVRKMDDVGSLALIFD